MKCLSERLKPCMSRLDSGALVIFGLYCRETLSSFGASALGSVLIVNQWILSEVGSDFLYIRFCFLAYSNKKENVPFTQMNHQLFFFFINICQTFYYKNWTCLLWRVSINTFYAIIESQWNSKPCISKKLQWKVKYTHSYECSGKLLLGTARNEHGYV